MIVVGWKLDFFKVDELRTIFWLIYKIITYL